jgi:hypothetical protein
MELPSTQKILGELRFTLAGNRSVFLEFHNPRPERPVAQHFGSMILSIRRIPDAIGERSSGVDPDLPTVICLLKICWLAH